MRKLKLLLILFIPFILMPNVNASTVPLVDSSKKVYDFADLLTDSEETNIYNLVMDYINKTSYDLVVVTINDNPKNSYMYPTRTYADDFYDYNNFKMDGLLLLIDMDNREYYISTSGEGILMYDDARIDGILDAMENSMKTSNYYNAIRVGINRIDSYYDSGIPFSNRNCEITSDGDYVCSKSMPYLLIAVISGIITAIVAFCITRSYKKIRVAEDADRYIDSSKTKITDSSDKFLYSNTVKVRKESSSSSTGRSGGGSSTHRGSSGRSHGGGGRRF